MEERASYLEKKRKLKGKFYLLYWRGNHPTEGCYDIIKLEKNGWSRKNTSTNKINAIMEEHVQENSPGEEFGTKNYSIYSCFKNNFHKNGFLIKVKIGNKPHQCLIDTSAEFSLLRKCAIPKETMIRPYRGIFRRVRGTPIKILSGDWYPYRLWKIKS